MTIKAEKPFAVLNFVTKGLDVLDAELAKSKILVFGYATTTEKALAQAPYRWGQTDSQALAINTAEVVGKQLVDKSAEFAGSEDLQKQPRKFAAVYMENVVDIDPFRTDLKEYGGALATENSYPANGSTFGDPAVAAEQAPTVVTKMKQAGVTTVILFSDFSMNKSMMEQATKQEWYPEWFFTGTVFQDVGVLGRQYPAEQASHAFGISSLSPYVSPDPTPPPPQKSLSVLTNSQNWYWGEGVGTSSASVPPHLTWLLQGVHAAGPKLTPQDIPAGAVLDAGRWRRGAGIPDGNDGGLRQDRGVALRRVHVGRARLRAHVVGSGNDGSVAGHGRGGHRCRVVRRRRQAIQGRLGAEETVRLVQGVDRRLQVRHPADAGSRIRG